MGSIAGLEIVHPMAIVILCGLVSSTAVSLFVLPALYLRFGEPAAPGVAPEDELLHRWAGVEPAPAAATATKVAVPVAADRGEAAPAREQVTGPRDEGAASSTTDAGEGESKEDEREPAV
jgi:hypothetical protein